MTHFWVITHQLRNAGIKPTKKKEVTAVCLRWRTQSRSGCRRSSKGTRTSVGSTTTRVPSASSTLTSRLCPADLTQTAYSTWRCPPPSTTRSPRTSNTAAWAKSELDERSVYPAVLITLHGCTASSSCSVRHAWPGLLSPGEQTTNNWQIILTKETAQQVSFETPSLHFIQSRNRFQC